MIRSIRTVLTRLFSHRPRLGNVRSPLPVRRLELEYLEARIVPTTMVPNYLWDDVAGVPAWSPME